MNKEEMFQRLTSLEEETKQLRQLFDAAEKTAKPTAE
jgi:cell shape-determining protein MreC